ncbi:hypothetical protein [Dubosiella newyorkensis]|jgi:hypothetical protein|uniref:hypothetical protein n=1 Tax=Dubosiella newyorkensis TaxID=1862672 RepID=UPI0023536A83|nr:hypothetical protein [Dubosiella newyorkensis]MCI9042120.1 hypothetical protein [Dubosiella newyorkensis]
MQYQESLQALLINKKKGISYRTQKPIFQLVFQTHHGIISLDVEENAFYTVMIGYSGLLKYEDHRVLSFGPWIQETMYPYPNRIDLSWLNS